VPSALPRIVLALLAAAAVATAGPARAQSAVFGPGAWRGMAELGLGAADGERSWLDGGFGKSSLSGSADGDWQTRAGLNQAVLEWRPQFGFAASAVVSAQWQAKVHPGLDLDEAYLKLRAPPMEGGGRLSGRIGLFYPPISLEHGGVGWTTEDLLSASALNTWIGEEVKVAGAEVTFSRRIGGHELAATGAVFGWNDTSGTLLSFRGWALDGIRAGAQTEFELPPLSAFMRTKQDDETYPTWEIDGRPGYYARLEWRPPAPVALNAFYYDNRGDRTSMVEPKQWSWETRFWNLGLDWAPGDRTRVRAQAMNGVTYMGFATPQTWIDVRFRAAYVMATRDLGPGALTGRLDWFDVQDRTFQIRDDNDENGWAATAGWRQPLTRYADLLVEAQRIHSKRPSRALAGEAANQTQNVLQSAIRLHF
jgi:hypothetical protein